MAGARRLFSADSLVGALRTLLLAAILLCAGVWLAIRWAPDLLALAQGQIGAIGPVLARLTLEALGTAVVVLLPVCVVDVGWQRFSHRRQLRMSVDEVRREHRDHEGDPRLKQARIQQQRSWAAQDAASGVYVIIAKTGNRVISRRLLVQK